MYIPFPHFLPIPQTSTERKMKSCFTVERKPPTLPAATPEWCRLPDKYVKRYLPRARLCQGKGLCLLFTQHNLLIMEQERHISLLCRLLSRRDERGRKREREKKISNPKKKLNCRVCQVPNDEQTRPGSRKESRRTRASFTSCESQRNAVAAAKRGSRTRGRQHTGQPQEGMS